MYCTKCGTPLNEAGICPVCAAAPAPALTSSPVENQLKAAISDTLFLIMAILLCVTTALSLVDFSLTAVLASVPNILFIISMWMMYASSKSEDSPVSRSGLKIVHGTSIALYIIGWVAFVSLALISIVVFIAYMANSINYNALSNILYNAFPGASGLSANILMALICIALILITVFTAIFTIFFHGNMKKFTLSLRTSADTGDWNIQKANVLRTWLIALGIINAVLMLISALFTQSGAALDFITVILNAASYIITGIWIDKHFVDTKNMKSNNMI